LPVPAGNDPVGSGGAECAAFGRQKAMRAAWNARRAGGCPDHDDGR
jgi:hypothetical protein